eukprot:7192961-Prymnesium_polylepis.1
MAHVARLDERAFASETARLCQLLDSQRAVLKARSGVTLEAALAPAFAATQGDDRVTAFARWYYCYGTSYELMRVGTAAAVQAVPTGGSAKAAASEAVTAAVLDKYSAVVLQPSISEPALRR